MAKSLFQFRRNLMGFPGVLDDFIQTRMFAQEAIPKWQRIRARTWTCLHTFSEIGDANIRDAAILNAMQGSGFYFYGSTSHFVLLRFKSLYEKNFVKQLDFSIG